MSPWPAFFLGMLVGVVAACGLFLWLSNWLDNREQDRKAVERDAVRLDWLMRHVPGRALRPLIGVMAWSGDIDEFRAAIDAAAGKEST